MKHRIATSSGAWHSEIMRNWRYSRLLIIALEMHFRLLHGGPLLEPLMRQGETLREYMRLPSKFRILLDSGAFELALPTFASLREQFTNADLIDVATLAQPDLVVPLDRIIKDSDDETTRRAKNAETIRHTRELVESSQIEKSQIIGPLHGSPAEMVQMVEQYREWGITYFGVGGPVFRPLDWVKETLPVVLETLRHSRERLHIFGMKIIDVGGDRQELYYLQMLAEMGKQYDVALSTDTSRNILRTQRGFYMTKDGRFVHLRKLEALDCDEPCCHDMDIETMRQRLQARDVAKKKLFIHNSYRWFKVAYKLTTTSD